MYILVFQKRTYTKLYIIDPCRSALHRPHDQTRHKVFLEASALREKRMISKVEHMIQPMG